MYRFILIDENAHVEFPEFWFGSSFFFCFRRNSTKNHFNKLLMNQRNCIITIIHLNVARLAIYHLSCNLIMWYEHFSPSTQKVATKPRKNPFIFHYTNENKTTNIVWLFRCSLFSRLTLIVLVKYNYMENAPWTIV